MAFIYDHFGGKYDKRAVDLSGGVADSEARQKNCYEDDQVRRAICNARQDIVLMVSYLSSLNRQVRGARWLLVSIFLVQLLSLALRKT